MTKLIAVAVLASMATLAFVVLIERLTIFTDDVKSAKFFEDLHWQMKYKLLSDKREHTYKIKKGNQIVTMIFYNLTDIESILKREIESCYESYQKLPFFVKTTKRKKAIEEIKAMENEIFK